MDYLADQPHIDRLSASLWEGQGIGRASVMIGAGFSRCARPVSPNCPLPPLWPALAGQMYDRLQPKGSIQPEGERLRQRASAIAGSGTLQVATEYEAQFGRSALESLLTTAVTDANFLPGAVHDLLVSLPWADVLTTNYDTLIERAAATLPGSKYDVVNTAADLAHATKPRIVKLHGSFPSHRPFVLTEEDFRSYPRRQAPFVNLAQQAVMETALCLLGFSGDDPNFLLWSGWVRDQLGPQMPNIYLVGLLHLSPARRLVLASRNVTPIDLSPLFSAERQPDPDVRHANAIEWFLRVLLQGRPADPMDWPRIDTEQSPITNPAIPPLPPSHAAPNLPPRPSPKSSKLDAAELDQFLKLWQLTRERYPGWVNVPWENFRGLPMSTAHDLVSIIPSLADAPAPANLAHLAEVIWRTSRCLVRLEGELLQSAETLVSQFEPFSTLPARPSVGGPSVIPHTPQSQPTWDWRVLREAWHRVNIELLRAARLRFDAAAVNSLVSRLETASQDRADWRAELLYERAMWHLFNFEQAAARSLLHDWPSADQHLMAGVRRASVAYQVGMQAEARGELDAVLREVARRRRPGRDDLALLSIEACALNLAERFTPQMQRLFPGPHLQAIRSRTDALARHRCDPDGDLRELASELRDLVHLRPLPQDELVSEFDPGVMSFSTNQSSSVLDEPNHVAMALPLACEATGLPLSELNLKRESLREWARRLARVSDELCVTILARYARSDSLTALDDVLTRSDVAVMDKRVIDSLAQIMLRATADVLDLSAAHVSADGRQMPPENAMAFYLEVLSRLTFRLDEAQIGEVLAIAERTLPLMHGRISIWWGKPLTRLFKRIAFAWPPELAGAIISRFLSLPLAAGGGVGSEHRDWSDPLTSTRLPTAFDDLSGCRAECKVAIANLLARLAAASQTDRSTIVGRLGWAYKRGLLDDTDRNRFRDLLWAVIDPQTSLPLLQGFYLFASLTYPSPDPQKVKDLFTTKLASLSFDPVLAHPGARSPFRSLAWSTQARSDLAFNLHAGIRTPYTRRTDADQLATLSNDQAEVLLSKVEEWWAAEESAWMKLSANGEAVDQYERNQLATTIQAIGFSLLPYVHPSEHTRARILGLLGRFDAAGISSVAAWPATLFLFPDLVDETTRSIRRAFANGHRESVHAAGEACLAWLTGFGQGKLPPAPTVILDELVRIVVGRRQPALRIAAMYLCELLRDGHDVLTTENIGDLDDALDLLWDPLTLRSWKAGEPSDDIPLLDLPIVRAEVAALAVQLQRFCERTGRTVPPNVVRWVAACPTDPLPEVRAAMVLDRTDSPDAE